LLTVEYTASPGVVEIEGWSATNDTPLAITDLSRTIVGGVVSEHELTDEDGRRRFRLVKRARP
jgi:hypothetical protein